jgi:hypothetical protein
VAREAAEDGRLLMSRSARRGGAAAAASRAAEARLVWREIAAALAGSSHAGDRELAVSIERFAREATRDSERERHHKAPEPQAHERTPPSGGRPR